MPSILIDAEGTQSFFVLENVFAVPAFAYTLLSVSSLVCNSASLDISRSHQRIILPSPGQGASVRAIPLREANDGLYLIDTAIATVSDVCSPGIHVLGAFRDPHTFQHLAALPADELATAMFLRLPFGAEKLRRLAITSPDVPSRIAQGTPWLEDTWSIANAKFTAHAGARPPCPPSTGSVTHTDVCGPFNHVVGHGNSKYFVVFVDGHSNYLYAAPIHDTSSEELKRATLAYIASFNFNALAANVSHDDVGADALQAALSDITVKAMHSDRGSNYMSADFEMFLRGKGIAHTTSPAYAKAINGVAERRIGMITDIARYYMLLSGAPFWPYAVQHAAGALNLVIHGGSAAPPLEIITGSWQRVVNHLPFGCAAVVTRQVRERDNKLVARRARRGRHILLVAELWLRLRLAAAPLLC